MKGIILAGGAGSRLYPLTLVASKQLQPVYDKPMVYYPLTTLIEGGIRDLCLISTPQDLPRFKQLLGDGRAWGLSIEYREQPKPAGIAQAFFIAESFIGRDSVTLILGDNVFYGGDSFHRAFAEFKTGAAIFGYHVNDPERYGVVEFDAQGQAISIEEKPKQARSNYAVPGLYLYDNNVVAVTKTLKPSARGELEITDVNVAYLRRGQLRVHRLSRGFAWLDAGTSSSLHEASAYVQTIEKRAGVKIGCPEEAAFRAGFLSLRATGGTRQQNAEVRIPRIPGQGSHRGGPAAGRIPPLSDERHHLRHPGIGGHRTEGVWRRARFFHGDMESPALPRGGAGLEFRAGQRVAFAAGHPARAAFPESSTTGQAGLCAARRGV